MRIVSEILIIEICLKDERRIFIREPTRKNHGIASEEIRLLMMQRGFLKRFSRESYSFPIRKKVCEGVFVKMHK